MLYAADHRPSVLAPRVVEAGKVTGEYERWDGVVHPRRVAGPAIRRARARTPVENSAHPAVGEERRAAGSSGSVRARAGPLRPRA